MRFHEAMTAVYEGKRVKRKKWCKNEFVDRKSKVNLYVTESTWDHDDWELLSEPEQLLSFSDVVKGLKEGKKYRRKSWVGNLNLHICLARNCFGNWSSHFFDNKLWFYNIDMEDIEALDWVEVDAGKGEK